MASHFDKLNERDKKEVLWARTYKAFYGHGTSGHNQLLLIASQSESIELLEGELEVAYQMIRQQTAMINLMRAVKTLE